jgi:hypothetical protein
VNREYRRGQEGTEHAPLWGPSVDDQQSGDVVSYLHHLGAARQEVQDPIAQGGVETQGLELNVELGEYYGAKLLSINSIFTYSRSSCPDGIGQCAVCSGQCAVCSVVAIASSVEQIGVGLGCQVGCG